MFSGFIGSVIAALNENPDDFDALRKRIKEADKSKLTQEIGELIKKQAEREKEMEAMAARKKSQKSASKKVDSSKQASYSSSQAVAMDKTIKAPPKPAPIDISQRLEAIRPFMEIDTAANKNEE